MSTRFSVGEDVQVTGKGQGVVRFIGETEFAPGVTWVGVELSTPSGKNNGSVKGVEYFKCGENCGCFVRTDAVKPLKSSSRSSAGSRTPSPRSAASGSPKNADGTARPRSPKTPGTPTSTKGIAEGGKSVQSSISKAKSAIKEKRLALEQRRLRVSKNLGTPAETGGSSPTAGKAAVTPPVAPVVDNAVMKELESKLKESKASVEDLQSQIVFFKETLLEKDSRMSELEGLVEGEKKKRTETENKVRALEAQLERSNLESDAKSKALVSKLERTVEKQSTELEELNEMIETLTLDKEQFGVDKELAEEKAIELELELEQLKLEFEEEKLQRETSSHQVVSEKSGDDAAASVLAENSKLREALSRLHSASTTEKTELARQVKALTKENETLVRDATEVKDLREKKKLLDEEVEELKSMLDTTQAYESMVESLSEKNLELADENSELREANDELEELRQLSEEVEQQHTEAYEEVSRELEKERSELAQAEIQAGRLVTEISTKDETIASLRSEILEKEEQLLDVRTRVEELEGLKGELSSTKRIAQTANLALLSEEEARLERTVRNHHAISEKRRTNFRSSCINALVPDTLVEDKTRELLDLFLVSLESLDVVSLVLKLCIDLAQSPGDTPPLSFVIARVCMKTRHQIQLLWHLLLLESSDFQKVVESWVPSFVPIITQAHRTVGSLLKIVSRNDIDLAATIEQNSDHLEELVETLGNSLISFSSALDKCIGEEEHANLERLTGTCLNLGLSQLFYLENPTEEEQFQASINDICTKLDSLEDSSWPRPLLFPDHLLAVPAPEEGFSCASDYFVKGGVKDYVLGNGLEKDNETLLDASTTKLPTCWKECANRVHEQLENADTTLKAYEVAKDALKRRVMEAHDTTKELAALQLVRDDLQHKLDTAREKAKKQNDIAKMFGDVQSKLEAKEIEYDQALKVAKEEAARSQAEIQHLRDQLERHGGNVVVESDTGGSPVSKLASQSTSHPGKEVAVEQPQSNVVDVSTLNAMRAEITFWKSKAICTGVDSLEPLEFTPRDKYAGRLVPLRSDFRQGEDPLAASSTTLLQKTLQTLSTAKVVSFQEKDKVSLKQQLARNRVKAARLSKELAGITKNARIPKKGLMAVGRIQIPGGSGRVPVLLSDNGLVKLHAPLPVY
mmetsp:Transcript_32602/g.51915  ORF Transcript_32602/g.51915 Transcript_32602/m.51915 type:complete len:1151 (-) Transcript_32602:38-3490(-)